MLECAVGHHSNFPLPHNWQALDTAVINLFRYVICSLVLYLELLDCGKPNQSALEKSQHEA